MPGHIENTIRVAKWIIRRAGITTVGELTEDRIEKALATLETLGKSARTINIYRSRLHAMCEYGIKHAKIIERNPAALVSVRESKPIRVRRALSPEEARRLLAIAGLRSLWYETALLTGLSVGELRQLQWGDLDLGVCPSKPFRLASSHFWA